MEITPKSIPAAGAVLWRRDQAENVQVALIHRPKYDDWSFPKGKVDADESHIVCAYREVKEETGYSSTFGPEIGVVIYEVEGIPKVVRYWAAKAKDEPTQQPNPEEVDQIEWLDPTSARKKLTLDDDRAILDFFLEFGVNTTPLVLLRHAKAVRRGDWDGDDGDRPLDNRGQIQAKRLSANFLPYEISEIHASDAMRCLETVTPLAESLKIKVVISRDLSEYRFSTHPESALQYAQLILDSRKSAIICSHNPILPNLLKKLIGKKNFKELEGKLNPGDAWVLHHRDGEIIAIDAVLVPEV